MKLVAESLEQLYDKGNYSPYLELLKEGIQFKNPKDAIKKATKILPKLKHKKRLNLLILLFLLNIGSLSVQTQKDDLKNNKIILDLAKDNNLLTYDEILNAFKEIQSNENIFKVSNNFISDLNTIIPGRFSKEKIERYNKYDDQIIKASEDLKKKGHNVNPNIIKAIMLIETGMNPVKNYLGYEGFPQTKEKIINYINKKYGTNFTLSDMYDPYKASQFIHFYIKNIQKHKFINSLEDIVIAYNWGSGNLQKYKKGEKDLPDQSKKYVKMINAMKKHFEKT